MAAESMRFPETVEEFMEQYKIVDTEQIYTNGVELVPIFRMQQWFEHLPAADVRPVVQGEWVGIGEYLQHLEKETGKRYRVSNLYDGSLFCNKCWEMSKKRSNFCHNCGADMRGDINSQ